MYAGSLDTAPLARQTIFRDISRQSEKDEQRQQQQRNTKARRTPVRISGEICTSRQKHGTTSASRVRVPTLAFLYDPASPAICITDPRYCRDIEIIVQSRSQLSC